MVGEIRTGQDLQKIPRGKKLKAVYFPSDPKGAVVRWGDQSATHKTLLGGKNHDYFNRKGDNVTGGKQGYITIDSNGNMAIQ